MVAGVLQMIELKSTQRITLETVGGKTLDDICRDAARIKEMVFDGVQVMVVHNDRKYKVEAQTPYIVTPVDMEAKGKSSV